MNDSLIFLLDPWAWVVGLVLAAVGMYGLVSFILWPNK